MVEFQYTVEEQDHLQDLRLGVFLEGRGHLPAPESLREEAELVREHGSFTPQELEELADEIECSMWRGEHL